jgi:hypothetical protein
MMTVTAPFQPSLYKASTELTMEGHLFDSLTLNKVLDYILKHNANFLLTSIRIGQQKTDPSRVSFTLYAKDEEHLASVLKELKVYGVNNPAEGKAKTQTVTANATLPEGAFIVGYMPVSVHLDSNTKAGSSGDALNPLLLVVDGSELSVCPQSHLKIGQQVVVGDAGIQWQ